MNLRCRLRWECQKCAVCVCQREIHNNWHADFQCVIKSTKIDWANDEVQFYKTNNIKMSRERKTANKNVNLWRNVKYMIRRWQRLLYEVLMLANSLAYWLLYSGQFPSEMWRAHTLRTYSTLPVKCVCSPHSKLN